MAFKAFIDSKGHSHNIYMQEKMYSCAIACACTIFKISGQIKDVNESEIRKLSQEFYGGYRPSVNDVERTQPTFVASLIKFGLMNSDENHIGTRNCAVSDVLAQYNLYSDESALYELFETNERNYISKLKDKIILLSLRSGLGRHSIIIRDVWEDGTFIIYDPQMGLVETKDLAKTYNLSYNELNRLSTNCSFVVYKAQLLENQNIPVKTTAYSFNSMKS